MKIDEFKAAAGTSRGWYFWFSVVLFVVLNLGRIAVCGFPADLDMALGPFAPYFTPVFLTTIVGSAAFMLWHYLSADAAEVYCQHCQHNLVGEMQIAVATRHCPQCGRRVLEEPSDAEQPEKIKPGASPRVSTSTPTIPLEDYLEAIHGRTRHAFVIFGVASCVVLAGIAGGSALVNYACGGPPAKDSGDWLQLTLLVAVMIGSLVAMFAVIGWSSMHGPLAKEMPCPGCEHEVYFRSNWVIATGCCSHCGIRVLAPPAGCDATKSSTSTRRVTADIEAACKESRENSNRRQAASIYATFGVILVVTFSAVGLMRWLEGSPPQYPLLWTSLLAASFVAILVAYLTVGVSYVSAAPGVRCAHCHAAIREQGGLVIATGNCVECGRRIELEELLE